MNTEQTLKNILPIAFILLLPLSVTGIVLKSVKFTCSNKLDDPKITFKYLECIQISENKQKKSFSAKSF